MSQFPDSVDPTRQTRPAHDQRRWFWTPAQRRALAALTSVAAVLLALSLVRRQAIIGDPPPSYPARFDDLRDRLNPNTASAAELAVLPGIGPSKAQAIVEYRATQAPPAFRGPMDLTSVRGIGEVTAAKVSPYLYFEETDVSVSPVTMPAVHAD